MENQERLRNCIQDLLVHKKEMDNLSKGWSEPLGIKQELETQENFQNILLASIQARAGPLLNVKRCKQIFLEFNKNLNFETINNLKDKEKLDYLYNLLDNLKYVGPKIALVILKDIVYCNKIYPELINELLLPIDTHIRKILINKLKVFDDDEVPKPSESITTKRNKIFQSNLAQIHTPRIEFDYLWCVGYLFCNKRVACHLCWIKNYCQERSFNGSDLNLREIKHGREKICSAEER